MNLRSSSHEHLYVLGEISTLSLEIGMNRCSSSHEHLYILVEMSTLSLEISGSVQNSLLYTYIWRLYLYSRGGYVAQL